MNDVKRVVREGMEYWDKICSVKHYGFIHSPDNSRVLKVEGIGSWIDMYEAQNVVDAAQHEINDLKAENESLRTSIEYQKCYIESLRADLRESYAIISSPENH